MAVTSFPKRPSAPGPMKPGPFGPHPQGKPFSTKPAKPMNPPGSKKAC